MLPYVLTIDGLIATVFPAMAGKPDRPGSLPGADNKHRCVRRWRCGYRFGYNFRDLEISQMEDRLRSRRLASLRELGRYLQPYKLQIAGAIVALLLSSMSTLGLVQGVRILIDAGLGDGSSAMLALSILVFGILVVLLSLATCMRHFLVMWLGERISADIRTEVFAHAIHLHPGYFEVHSAAEVHNRITADTTILQMVVGASASIALRNALLLAGGVLLLVFSNFMLSMIVMTSALLILVPIVLMGRRVRSLSRDSQSGLAGIGVYVSESLRHIKSLQAANHQGESERHFGSRVERTFGIAVQRIRLRSVLIALVMWSMLAALAMMLWFGGQEVLTQQMTSGELVAFMFYAFLVAGAAGALSEVYSDIQRAAGAMERLTEILATESEVPEPHCPASLPDEVCAPLLEVDGLSFHYPSRPEVDVLKVIGFRIMPGERIALVGPSGSGKTTLFDLILRFYDPTAGCLRLLGIDLRNLRFADLRRQIAVVPQEPALFTGTILSNIAYARPDATETELRRAASIGHLLGIAERLREGVGTEIRPEGVQLAGGQRQRIAIARTALCHPRLLLLDEATSSLDAENERMVQLGLDELTASCATLVIAHRLATVRSADRILLLNRGHLAATGDHATLLRENALYAQLARLQFPDMEAADLESRQRSVAGA